LERINAARLETRSLLDLQSFDLDGYKAQLAVAYSGTQDEKLEKQWPYKKMDILVFFTGFEAVGLEAYRKFARSWFPV